MTDILNRTIELNCSRTHAFHVFTTMTDLWWPRGHRKNSQSTIILQPAPGGRLFERNPDGSEWTIGEVISAEAPEALTFNWFPGSPAAPTHVDVRFEKHQAVVLVRITHSALSPDAQTIWPERVALFEKGWNTLLPALKQLAENGANNEDANA